MAKLFYVIGASGAGKDSILDYARHHLDKDAPVLFGHRYITRPADAGSENHRALTDAEFLLRSQKNCFAMQWQSHGLMYAVGKEIDDWLERGLSVVVNGSRQYLSTAAQKYPAIVPVNIYVDNALLAERLLKRGRETAQEIEERLHHSTAIAPIDHSRLVTIENNASLEAAGDKFLDVIYAETQFKTQFRHSVSH